MAFKWTKASRAKLSRSQKARWKNENDSSVGSALNVPPDSVIGVVKIGASVAGSGGSGRLDDPLTRTVGASIDRESVCDDPRICAGYLRTDGVVSASSEGLPICSARLTMGV